METKRCNRCKQEKELANFNWKDRIKEILQSSCSDCTKEISKSHYKRNREVYKKRAIAFTKNQRKKLAIFVVDYLRNHPCVDCGENDPIVLQFDHVRGTKRYDIAAMIAMGLGLKTLIIEIEKCDIRCANCHTKKTAIEQGWKYKVGPVA